MSVATDISAEDLAARERSIPFKVTSFVRDVEAEVMRARDKFPGADHLTVALTEEMGEAAKAVLDEPAERVYKECVQTAAMACRLALEGDRSLDKHRRLKGLDPLGNAAAAHARLTELGMARREYVEGPDAAECAPLQHVASRRHDPSTAGVDRSLEKATRP